MSYFNNFNAHLAREDWQQQRVDDDALLHPPASSTGNTTHYGHWSMQGTSFEQFPQGSTYNPSDNFSQSASLQGEIPQTFGQFSQGTTYNPSDLSQHASFQGSTASTSALEMAPIQRGKIPQTDVMHARQGSQRNTPTAERCRLRHEWLPIPTTRPQTISGPAPSATATEGSPRNLQCHREDGDEISHVRAVLWDSVPRCFAPNTTFEDFITSKHRQDVANALSITHRKFRRLHVRRRVQRISAFPSTTQYHTPVVYHQRVITKITTDADGMVFMHIYTFDQDGKVQIKAKFQNPFIMSSVIRFIWYGLRQEFLSETEEEKIEKLKVIWALASATTFCSLDEQSEDQVKIDRLEV
ncbi:hypothetical protein DFJ58DRAFT_728823 [Suillus subalutaceus]|uniref:uncharacterized protein n=1 Tax=Suillus subalutaceus TaxID=48586 RepID=UPI001B878FD5|nr:uncharacterized protein DFJ58DRAFT_728823 [Suillus subalutaceus]KAG1851602.1 hypothetical protein DFJ58DRAFT_728823 [Suillus subalutaceus]